MFEENSDRRIIRLSRRHHFRRAPRFKLLRFEERVFGKLTFVTVGVDGRPNRRNYSAFLNVSSAEYGRCLDNMTLADGL